MFLLFLQYWQQRRLAFSYQDSLLTADAAGAMLAASDPVRAFCEDQQIWGDLSGQQALYRLISEASQSLQAWLDGEGCAG